MKSELTLDEWEETVLLNSGVDASFFATLPPGRLASRGYPAFELQQLRGFKSPQGQMFFSTMFCDKIMI